jgi:predicted tellurium resistance membrane protein TerC
VDFLLDPNIWISLLTLTILEIVLGIDNIIFISILAGKLPKQLQASARRWGLILALGTRLLLLASLAFIVRLTAPWFTVLGAEISGRDLVLLAGGLFLIYKSTREIHERLEEHSSVGENMAESKGKARTFGSVLVQIALLDIVFSLDSVITAVGMASHLWIMVTAVIVAMIVMLVAVGAISRFVDNHPTVKMLALSFLLLVGTALIAEGLDLHIPKGYIYFAMAFSVLVEALNIRASRKAGKKAHTPAA